jgi:hypothetical protein
MMTTKSNGAPMLARLLLLQPDRVARNLEQVERAQLFDAVPNLWQLSLGVLRMWHRMAFRPDSIGTCREFEVRSTWRAQLLQFRPLRFPFLLAEGAVTPWDLTGLLSSRERMIRHLLGAHHDDHQFVYDLELLACYPGALEELHHRARTVVEQRDARSDWLRDLTVFERYHDNLLAAVERALDGDFSLPPGQADDPDISFSAYLRWCARQPSCPADTWQALSQGELVLS